MRACVCVCVGERERERERDSEREREREATVFTKQNYVTRTELHFPLVEDVDLHIDLFPPNYLNFDSLFGQCFYTIFIFHKLSFGRYCYYFICLSFVGEEVCLTVQNTNGSDTTSKLHRTINERVIGDQ